MPSSSLNVPQFQHELEYFCVAACVRMVLAYHGDVPVRSIQTKKFIDFRRLVDKIGIDKHAARPLPLGKVASLGRG